MARYKFSRPDQPIYIRLPLAFYEFCASLKLAVVLIFTLAAVLAVATFIESNTGTAGARYYVYQSNWFLWLLGCLAVNVFCAAAVRFPWKRYQTGFVITHIGLLTLLGGSAYSFRHSVNSQLLVYKGGTSHFGVDNDGGGDLVIEGLPGRTKPLFFNYRPGPFNWQDLEPGKISRQLATLVGRDDYPAPWVHPPELIYEDKATQTKVEVVDYYSRSQVRQLPFVGLSFKQSAMGMEMPAIDVEYDEQHLVGQAEFGGIGSVMLWRTDDPKRFAAFTECIPQQSVEGDGAVVIWANGEVFQFTIAQLKQHQKSGEPLPLSEKLTVELVSYAPSANMKKLIETHTLTSLGDEPKMPAVELKIVDHSKTKDNSYQVIRFAELPYASSRQPLPGISAEFYHPAMAGRIDLLEGPDAKLAYRVWQQKLGRVVGAGPLEKDHPVSTWSMGGGKAVWEMKLEKYLPRETPNETYRIVALPFDKDDKERGTSRKVKMRVSWLDENKKPAQDEFWLRQNAPPPWQAEGTEQIHASKTSQGTIATRFQVKEIDVGFTMRLDDFDLRVDPGSGTASNYTSFVTITDVRNDPKIRELRQKMADASTEVEHHKLSAEITKETNAIIEKLQADAADGKATKAEQTELAGALSQHVITMNEPLDYPDPRGRTLRFFQENYMPPRSGEPLASVFRVNYDPGRWIKYLGSLLITCGIFTMFYMRAYFFKPARKASANAGEPSAVDRSAKVDAREEQRV